MANNNGGMTSFALASALGISAGQVRHLRLLGMPTHSVEAAREWRKASLRPVTRRADADPDGSLAQRCQMARAGLMECKAEKARLDLAVRTGELIRVEGVQRWASQTFARVRTRLQAIPHEIAPLLPEPTRASTMALIAERIDAVLTELANGRYDGASAPEIE